MQKLTKDVILKGIQHREVLEVPKLGGSVTIRPLNDGELAEVRSVALRGLSDQAIRQITRIQQVGKAGDSDIDGLTGDDLMQAQSNNAQGEKIAAAYGLSCDGEKWSTEDVGRLPVGVPEYIASKVMALSGIGGDAANAVDNFRQNAGSLGDDIAA
jgi:hypothetical protein